MNAIFGGGSPYTTPPSASNSKPPVNEHLAAQTPTAPTEVRARVALRVPTLQHAQNVAHEVEALYLNGPAGGGGATRAVREVIAAAAVLMPRSAVHTSTVLLNAEGL
jgi:hypothetical protein